MKIEKRHLFSAMLALVGMSLIVYAGTEYTEPAGSNPLTIKKSEDCGTVACASFCKACCVVLSEPGTDARTTCVRSCKDLPAACPQKPAKQGSSSSSTTQH